MSGHEHADPAANRDSSRGQLPADAVADLLANERRQRLFAVLRDTQGPIAVTDLARRLAELGGSDDGEHGDAAEHGDATDDRVESLREEIYQDHLPKLTATEVVTYDSLVGTIELATDDERLLDSPTAEK